MRRFRIGVNASIDLTVQEVEGDEGEEEGDVALWTIGLFAPFIWYKADAITGYTNGQDVLVVPDSSGNGRTMTPYNGNAAYAPTYVASSQNSLPAVQYSGGFVDEMRTTTAAAMAQPFTFIWVGKTADNTDFIMSRSTYVGMSLRSGVVNMLDNNAGSPDVATGLAMNTTGWHVVVGMFNGATSSISVDGTLSGTVVLTGQAQINGIDIGVGNNNSSFAGLWGESAIIPVVISTGNRQIVEGVLAHKWGLAANLPSNHPYKSAPPQVGSHQGVRYTVGKGLRQRTTRAA